MATLHPNSVDRRKEKDEATRIDPKANRSHIEEEIEAWGELLEELKAKADTVGRETVEELERRYLDIRHDVITMRRQARNSTEEIELQASEQVSSLAKATVGKAEDLASAVSEQSKAAAQSAKESTKEIAALTRERAEDTTARITKTARELKKGSQDVAAGTKRAWDELKKGLELAMNRLR